MNEKDFLVDAVAQFVQESTWLSAVSDFMDQHYMSFLPTEDDAKEDAKDTKDRKVRGYTLAQYDLFMQFKDIAERLLEDVIGELGCSPDDFVAALEDGAAQSGPRRAFLETLLSFQDYDAFCLRISQYALEKHGSFRIEDATPQYTEYLLQLVLARSIVEASENGQLDASEEPYLPWAHAFLQMEQSSSSTQDGDGSEAKAQEKENDEVQDDSAAKVKDLEDTLVRERLKVDLLIAQRIADANSDMKKQMLQLVAEHSEEKGSGERSEEEDLDALLLQLDVTRDRLKVVKEKCFAFENVDQDQMDRLYLYLKEKIHHQQDLVSQEKDIADYIFATIAQDSAALVPLLLEWLLLESESLQLQTEIHQRLGQDPRASAATDDGYWMEVWDESAQAYYYFNPQTQESMWETPDCGYYDSNNEFQSVPPPAQGSDATVIETDNAAPVDPLSTLPPLAASIESFETNAFNLAEMEELLQKISKEHDEERKRLEILMQVEKARQKEELRRRKEKKRREKLARKLRKEKKDHKDDQEGEAETQSFSPSSHTNTDDQQAHEKHESKSSEEPAFPSSSELKSLDTGSAHGPLSMLVPGRGPIDLSHLLSEEHAKRLREKKNVTNAPAPTQAMLNPATVRYLTEQMTKKNPNAWGMKQELVLEEEDQALDKPVTFCFN